MNLVKTSIEYLSIAFSFIASLLLIAHTLITDISTITILFLSALSLILGVICLFQRKNNLFLSLNLIFFSLIMLFTWLGLIMFVIPTSFIILAVVLNFILLIIYIIRDKNKVLKKIIFSILGLMILTSSLFILICNPYWGSIKVIDSTLNSLEYNGIISNKEALEDLDYVMNHLNKVHLDTENDIEIKNKYLEFKQEIENKENLSVNELTQKIQSIISLFQDGHTNINLIGSTYYRKDYPIKSSENSEIIEVNGISIETLFEQKKHLFSYEVEDWGIVLLQDKLNRKDGYAFLDIDINDGFTLTYKKEDNTLENINYTKDDFIAREELIKQNNELTHQSNTFVSYEIDKNKDLAVLTLDECTYNEEYINTVNEMFTEVKENQINNVAVDLRNNPGGTSAVSNEFLRYLPVDEYYTGSTEINYNLFTIYNRELIKENSKYDNLTFNGNLYILTATETFSSATMFARDISDNNLGTLIGEVSGNAVNSYGDVVYFSTPNSNLILSVSHKEFHRRSCINGDTLVPDIKCDEKDVFNELDKLL